MKIQGKRTAPAAALKERVEKAQRNAALLVGNIVNKWSSKAKLGVLCLFIVLAGGWSVLWIVRPSTVEMGIGRIIKPRSIQPISADTKDAMDSTNQTKNKYQSPLKITDK